MELIGTKNLFEIKQYKGCICRDIQLDYIYIYIYISWNTFWKKCFILNFINWMYSQMIYKSKEFLLRNNHQKHSESPDWNPSLFRRPSFELFIQQRFSSELIPLYDQNLHWVGKSMLWHNLPHVFQLTTSLIQAMVFPSKSESYSGHLISNAFVITPQKTINNAKKNEVFFMMKFK